ncbi:MAG: DNA-directed RNA polymerase subunit delta [Bacillota bacterium]|jgi:DNA-directed RNA polymerase subunit delta|nr:DNA-directed RNA polymerase subunit delta [Bacillota bacterium]NLL26483.1 DNA-directed RNA polymerase subunit delta [Erysipelotrichia bacterium]
MSLKAVDMAYNLLLNTKEGMSFKELWTNINNKFGYDEKIASRKKSQFYTNLTLDGRFVMLENNVWNLKSRCRYQEIEVKDDDEYEESEDYDEEDEEEFDEDEEDEEESEEDEY